MSAPAHTAIKFQAPLIPIATPAMDAGITGITGPAYLRVLLPSCTCPSVLTNRASRWTRNGVLRKEATPPLPFLTLRQECGCNPLSWMRMSKLIP